MPAPLIITMKSDLFRATKEVGFQFSDQSLWYMLKYRPSVNVLLV